MGNGKTIAGKVIALIFSVFKRDFPGWIRKISHSVPYDVKQVLGHVIDVVENIKEYADSPVADFLTAVIPGHWDDELKEWVRESLARVMYIPPMEKTLGMAINTDEDNLHALATKLTKELTGMPFGQSAITIEAAYQRWKLDKQQ